jgi:hypothetical protein
MAVDIEKFSRMLQNDNEIVANNLLSIVRQNISMYDFGKDKAKFLEEKKKEIMVVLRQYDEEAFKIFKNEIMKLNSKHQRSQSESQAAIENRSFVKKIKTDFDRSDSHNAIKSKNLGIIEA